MGRSTANRLEPIEQGPLSFIDPGAGRSEIEPRGAIDLWKRLSLSASRRPFELERIASDIFDIEIGFDGKRGDGLAAALSNLAESKQISGHFDPKLFPELPPSHVFRSFTGAIFAFRDRPRAEILVAPEGSARVNQEDLDLPMLPAEGKDASAF
jgi:hypothetical protein